MIMSGISTRLASSRLWVRNSTPGMSLPPWGEDLWEVEEEIKKEDFDNAQQKIYQILGQNPDFPLPAIVHLKLNLITPGCHNGEEPGADLS